jgi:hypothetical protein
MKEKIKKWYRKERKGKFWGFTNWIVSDSFAFTIILRYSHIVPVVLFGGLFIFSLIGKWFMIVRIILFAVTALAIWNLVKFTKRGGFKVEIDTNINEFMGDKNDNEHESNANDIEPYGQNDREIGERISEDYQEPESNDISFSDLISESEEIEPEFDENSRQYKA